MRAQAVGFMVRLLDDAAHLGVDQLQGGLAIWLVLEGRRQASSWGTTKLIGSTFSLVSQPNTAAIQRPRAHLSESATVPIRNGRREAA
jgi:hypothetical protein